MPATYGYERLNRVRSTAVDARYKTGLSQGSALQAFSLCGVVRGVHAGLTSHDEREARTRSEEEG